MSNSRNGSLLKFKLTKKEKEKIEKDILPRATRFTTKNWFKEVNKNIWYLTIKDIRISRFDIYVITKNKKEIRRYKFFKYEIEKYKDYWYMIFTRNIKKALRAIQKSCKTPWQKCEYEVVKGGKDDSS